MGHWARARAQPQKARWLGPCPMALSYVYGPVLCPMALDILGIQEGSLNPDILI